MNLPKLYKVDSTGELRTWEIKLLEDRLQIKYGVVGSEIISDVNEPRTSSLAFEAQSRWNKQIERKGYSIEIPTYAPPAPMLAHVYDQHGDKLPNVLYMQPKLDGIRCIATITAESVVLTSRQNTTITSCPQIIDALSKFPPGTVLDGELYSHGKKFHEIQSLVRKEDPNPYSPIKYHIYDIFTDEVYTERYRLLSLLLEHNNFGKHPSLAFVETTSIEKSRIEVYIQQYVDKGYEGIILRDPEGYYEQGKRSTYLQKHKLWVEEEFEIVNIVSDRKNRGMFELQVTENHLRHTERRTAVARNLFTFLCTPSLPHAVRTQMLAYPQLFVGKICRCKFKEWTSDNKPREPIGVATYGKEASETPHLWVKEGSKELSKNGL